MRLVCVLMDIKPTHWYTCRYVDAAVEVDKQENITSVTNIFNQQDPEIQITAETQSKDNCQQHLPLLDVDIWQLEDGSSTFQVYHEKTHTDQDLNFNSHHPLHQILGVIWTSFNQARILVMDKLNHQEEIIDNIKEALRNAL